MSDSWNTKWGSRRVRHDPPTLAEALAAAQGLTDDRTAQVKIAADLMGVAVADAESEMSRLSPSDRRATETFVTQTREKGSTRTVVVERRTSRRLQPSSPTQRMVSRPR